MITINDLGKLPEFKRNVTEEEKINPDIGNFHEGFIPLGYRIIKLDGNGFFYIQEQSYGLESPLKFPIDSAHIVEWNR